MNPAHRHLVAVAVGHLDRLAEASVGAGDLAAGLGYLVTAEGLEVDGRGPSRTSRIEQVLHQLMTGALTRAADEVIALNSSQPFTVTVPK